MTLELVPTNDHKAAKERKDLAKKMFFAGMLNAVLERVEDAIPSEDIEYISANTYGTYPSLSIHAKKDKDVREMALRIAEFVRKGAIVKKNFVEYDGSITYSFTSEHDPAVKIEVKGGEPRCKVRKVTTRELVPATSEHYEERTRFVIDNPEECWTPPSANDEGGN